MSKLKIIAGVIIALAYINRKLINDIIGTFFVLGLSVGLIWFVVFLVTRGQNV